MRLTLRRLWLDHRNPGKCDGRGDLTASIALAFLSAIVVGLFYRVTKAFVHGKAGGVSV
jgi:hypothetical protein